MAEWPWCNLAVAGDKPPRERTNDLLAKLDEKVATLDLVLARFTDP